MKYDKNGTPICKCGVKMLPVMKREMLSADYVWTCVLRRWSNFWQHTASFPLDERRHPQ